MSCKYFLPFIWLFYFAYDEFVGGDELIFFYHTEMFYLYIGKCMDLLWQVDLIELESLSPL